MYYLFKIANYYLTSINLFQNQKNITCFLFSQKLHQKTKEHVKNQTFQGFDFEDWMIKNGISEHKKFKKKCSTEIFYNY